MFENIQIPSISFKPLNLSKEDAKKLSEKLVEVTNAAKKSFDRLSLTLLKWSDKIQSSDLMRIGSRDTQRRRHYLSAIYRKRHRAKPKPHNRSKPRVYHRARALRKAARRRK